MNRSKYRRKIYSSTLAMSAPASYSHTLPAPFLALRLGYTMLQVYHLIGDIPNNALWRWVASSPAHSHALLPSL